MAAEALENNGDDTRLSLPVSPLESLPTLVLDKILEVMPDVFSMRAAVLSTPIFHEVFSIHRTTIERSVLINDFGPLVRALYYAETHPSSRITDECMSRPHLFFSGSLSTEEERAITHYRQTARRFEVYFTVLWKDRQARCNQLTAQEMFYFERAFYRFWILAIFTNRTTWDMSISKATHNRNVSDLMAFLSLCTDTEISQLWDVNALIDRMARWPTGGEPILDMPDRLLQSFESGIATPFEDETFSDGIQLICILSLVYKVHDLADMWAKSEPPMESAILVDGRAHSDECPTCGKQPTLLWGDANWHLLRCYTPAMDFMYHLPGNLRHNWVVCQVISGLLQLPQGAPVIYASLVRIRSQGVNDTGFSWSSDLYICQSCLVGCFERNAFVFLYTLWTHANLIPADKCPDGWDCELQGTEIHARSFDHFCPPRSSMTEAGASSNTPSPAVVQ